MNDVDFNKEYWNSFYKKFQRHTPSQFCVSVVTDLSPGSVVLELGSGNGRDAHYFASQGFVTIAIDLSPEAISSCNNYAEVNQILHSFFIQGDISDEFAVEEAVHEARSQSGNGAISFYSRFVMHSIDEKQQESFLNALSKHLQAGDDIYFEFRSKEDAKLNKHFGGHFRRYVDTDQFCKALVSVLGLSVNYRITGQGMARFKEEDPYVSRVIARKL